MECERLCGFVDRIVSVVKKYGVTGLSIGNEDRDLLLVDLLFFKKICLSPYELQSQRLRELSDLPYRKAGCSYYYDDCRENKEKEKGNFLKRYASIEDKTFLEKLFDFHLPDILSITRISYLKNVLNALTEFWDVKLQQLEYLNFRILSKDEVIGKIKKYRPFDDLDFNIYYVVYGPTSDLPRSFVEFLEMLVDLGIVIYREEECRLYESDRNTKEDRKIRWENYRLYIFPPSKIISQIVEQNSVREEDHGRNSGFKDNSRL